MGPIIKEKKHYLTRLPIWLVIIVLIGFSPTIIGLLGAWITKLKTGQPCHGGGCEWLTLSWLTIITLPIAGLLLLVFLIIILIDSLNLSKSK